MRLEQLVPLLHVLILTALCSITSACCQILSVILVFLDIERRVGVVFSGVSGRRVRCCERRRRGIV